jgi:AraC family transcriptional regulator, regulatory protein of adaptative response / methylated-DNA-[protein]-cysteine methyltransferase
MNAAAKHVHAATTLADPRWQAVLARDSNADGTFYYSVSTTGVYCRPSCAARQPRPEHVVFHVTREDAERAGFRPCKRCRPDAAARDATYAARIADACRAIDDAETLPDLATLARRGERVRTALARGERVTDAIYEAGFSSSGRFYSAADGLLGMTPSRYRAGGDAAEIRFAIGECSLGAILVAQSERGVCAILLGDDPDRLARDLQDRFPNATLIGGDTAFERLVARVVGFVEAPAHGLDLPLHVRGTAFQQRVWQALCEIPPGATASYGEIAARIGAPKASRAVAQACAANTLAVAIPCHRVVRTDGDLSGYRWGVERKRALLAREGAITAT